MSYDRGTIKQVRKWLNFGCKLTQPSWTEKVTRGRASNKTIVATNPIGAIQVGFSRSTEARKVRAAVLRSEQFWPMITELDEAYYKVHGVSFEDDIRSSPRDTIVDRIRQL